jgi:enediyne polyketide synthase
VELVVDAELSGDSDPYLDAHVYGGARLLPAVLGLEAMAQISTALAESDRPPVFEDVVFARPVSVPPGGRTAIRLAALVRGPGLVEVALRSAETDFQTDHFRARCRFGPADEAPAPLPQPELPPVELDPARELYGGLLFQQGGFQRLRGYRQLGAYGCTALVEADGRAPWFGRFLPQTLLLGDPGAHDALIHAIQVCVPHLSLLPVGVERLTQWGAGDGTVLLRARERERDGDLFVYDLEALGDDGRLRERWEGLRLQVVRSAADGPPEQPQLLGPYIERRVAELLPGRRLRCALERCGDPERRGRSDLAIQHALGRPAAVRRRPDGRPEVEGGVWVSAAHSGDLTLALAAEGPAGCDIEAVAPRPASLWSDLLGLERFALAQLLTQELRSDLDRAATLVWSAAESLRKLGAPPGAPLLLEQTEPDGWALLGADGYRLACYIAAQAGGAPLALALGVQTAPAPLSGRADETGAELVLANHEEER